MDQHEPISSVTITAGDVNEKNEKSEKNEKNWTDIEVDPIDVDDFAEIPATKVLVPDEHDEFIDPRLKDYPIPLVA